MQLRPYQQLAVDDATAWLRAAPAGAKRLYAAPTGTGKSVIELALLAAFPESALVTPRVEIQAGLLEKLGVSGVPLSGLTPVAEQHRIYTPIRLRNLLSAGVIGTPAQLIIDEGHHAEADTYVELDALVGSVPAVAFSATPFRGTPKSTAAFRRRWGESVRILSFGEAAGGGYLSVPTCSVVPLIDDDSIEVSNGEFVVTQLDDAIGGVIPAVVELCRPWVSEPVPLDTPPFWDRPTMFTVPTVEAAFRLGEALDGDAMPCRVVVGGMPSLAREEAFRACVDHRAALVQINVVSEGIDLPLRRLVDLRPTLSPVLWQQTLGRITRPVGKVTCPRCHGRGSVGDNFTGKGWNCPACNDNGTVPEAPPEYVCCCRNLLRHAYLLDGCIPADVIRRCEVSFNGVGRRAGLRVLGFEGLGHFAETPLPLADGTTGVMYMLSAVNGTIVTEYAVLASPRKSDVLVAERQSVRCLRPKAEGDLYAKYEYTRGPWVRVDAVPDVTGFSSVTPRPITEKQKAWWARSAGTRGLAAGAVVNARQFQALPVLFDIKEKML